MIAAILSILGSSAVGSLIGGVFAFLNRTAIELSADELAAGQRPADIPLS